MPASVDSRDRNIDSIERNSGFSTVAGSSASRDAVRERFVIESAIQNLALEASPEDQRRGLLEIISHGEGRSQALADLAPEVAQRIVDLLETTHADPEATKLDPVVGHLACFAAQKLAECCDPHDMLASEDRSRLHMALATVQGDYLFRELAAKSSLPYSPSANRKGDERELD